MLNPNPEVARFDRVARDYDALHRESISASGEDASYFARYKLDCIMRLGCPTGGAFLDFGCGIGNLLELLEKSFSEVHGYDPSKESLAVARERARNVRFHENVPSLPDDYFSTVALAGVLHHVAPAERLPVVRTVHRKLRVGGQAVVFEHNPLNPLTRRAVAACPFDDDAVLLRASELRHLFRAADFDSVTLRYIVFFPRALRFFRPLEPMLGRLALGAQMMLIARKGRS